LKLYKHSVTANYIDLQTCEKFSGINPLEYFYGSDAKWEDHPYFKKVLFVYRLLNAEEEKRQYDELENMRKNQGNK
jgi:hypothetical protein